MGGEDDDDDDDDEGGVSSKAAEVWGRPHGILSVCMPHVGDRPAPIYIYPIHTHTQKQASQERNHEGIMSAKVGETSEKMICCLTKNHILFLLDKTRWRPKIILYVTDVTEGDFIEC